MTEAGEPRSTRPGWSIRRRAQRAPGGSARRGARCRVRFGTYWTDRPTKLALRHCRELHSRPANFPNAALGGIDDDQDRRRSFLDLVAQPRRPADPDELVCRGAYRTVSRELVRVVEAAQATLRAADREDEAARLDGVTGHALRHTFASRLVAAGVDLRTVQELGGWRTLSMVQRYAHLSAGHLAAAVEKIVAVSAAAPRPARAAELRENFESAATAPRELEVRH